MTRLKQFFALLSAAFFYCATSGAAPTPFVLTPSVENGAGSNEVFFSGAITNLGASNLFLNSIAINFDGAAANYLSADTNIFFANVPGILLPGETYTQSLVFGVAISPSTPPGQYTGEVTIVGGTNIFAGGNLSTQTFEISLPPASLAIASAGTNTAISWPSPPGGFVLEQNSNLTTTNWITVTNAPFQTNGLNQLNVAPLTHAEFYRLEYP
jgi:hypothetical protein